MKKLVVVAPTFDEEDNIENFLIAVLSQQQRLDGYQLEIVVSDSHSTDATAKIVKKIAGKNRAVHYLDVKKRGLGLGLTGGLNYATDKLSADVLITMEADLSADPNEFSQFLEKLEKCDLVIGSRYVTGGKIVNWSLWRKLASRIGNYVLRFFAGTNKIHEFTNLYRVFDKNVWLKLKDKISMHDGWLFVPAFTFEALNLRIKICEQPMVFYDRFGGRSKMRTLSYTKNLLHYALRYRLKKLWTIF